MRASVRRDSGRRGAAFDTHFKLEGPAIADFHIASEDWRFGKPASFTGEAWKIALPENPLAPERWCVVGSGPDKNVETNQRMMMGAFDRRAAYSHHDAHSLPDHELISALVTADGAACRWISSCRVNNLKLWTAPCAPSSTDQLLKDGCRIRRAGGAFCNISKLMTIDGAWSQRRIVQYRSASAAAAEFRSRSGNPRPRCGVRWRRAHGK